jgi:hypothetical protein
MAQYLKYKLEDASELWIEVSEPDQGVALAGLGDKIQEAKQSFAEALQTVHASAMQLRNKFHDLQADEVEVKFGLKATGEVGNNIFAVGKVGVEANYEVTLKWKKNDVSEPKQRIQHIWMRWSRRKRLLA